MKKHNAKTVSVNLYKSTLLHGLPPLAMMKYCLVIFWYQLFL